MKILKAFLLSIANGDPTRAQNLTEITIPEVESIFKTDCMCPPGPIGPAGPIGPVGIPGRGKLKKNYSRPRYKIKETM